MSRIVAPQGEMAHWQALVAEAGSHVGVHLDEELESYLVFTLMRYLSRPDMAQRALALDFLQAFHEHATLRNESLRDVGDQCLLVSGLFPQRARRRRTRVGYYVDLGRSAYHNLAEGLTQLADLFERLARQFVNAMDVLQAMRLIGRDTPALDPLLAWDLWNETGSRSAKQALARHTDGQAIHLASSRKH